MTNGDRGSNLPPGTLKFLENLPPGTREFLECFFGEGNGIKWEEILAGKWKDLEDNFLGKCIAPLKKDNWESVLLPRSVPDSGKRYWYGLASSKRKARELLEDLAAYIGPSYGIFTGTFMDKPSDGDSVEKCVFEFLKPMEGKVYRLPCPQTKGNKAEAKAIRDCIRLMYKAWDERPERGLRVPRSSSRVLRELNWALLQENEGQALELIKELEAKGNFSASNLAFLKVRYFSRFRKLEELRDFRQLNEVISLRKPQLVSEAIAEWAYLYFLLEYEDQKPEKMVAEVKKLLGIEKNYHHIFEVLGSIQSPIALKAFMAYAAVPFLQVKNNPPKGKIEAALALRDRVLARYPQDDAGWEFIQKLAAWIQPPQPQAAAKKKTPEESLEEKAEAAFNREDNPEQAFELYLELKPGESQAGRLLYLAERIGTLGAARRALEAFGSLSEKKRKSVLESSISRESLEKLEAYTSIGGKEDGQVISGWIGWLERISRPEPWPQAGKVAELGCSEWKVSALQGKSTEIKKAKKLLGETVGRAGPDFWNALPSVVEAFTALAKPPPEFKTIYFELMEALAMSDSVGGGEVNAVCDLCEASLESGLNKKEYGELIDVLEMTWDKIKSPRYLDRAADILDLLINNPSIDQKRVSVIADQFLASLSRFSRRVPGYLWDLFEDLYGDLKRKEDIHRLRPEIKAGSEQESLDERRARFLKGKLVGIYTLTPSVSQRFEKILKKTYPEVEVRSNNKGVASDPLKKLAEGADYLVVVIRSAKHAATRCIELHGSEEKILRTSGKGVSSALARLFEAVDKDLEGNGSSQAA